MKERKLKENCVKDVKTVMKVKDINGFNLRSILSAIKLRSHIFVVVFAITRTSSMLFITTFTSFSIFTSGSSLAIPTSRTASMTTFSFSLSITRWTLWTARSRPTRYVTIDSNNNIQLKC